MDARELTLRELTRHCREETGRYLRHLTMETAYCFEIFRRAIAERNDEAWDAVFVQYRGVVLAWIHRHPMWRVGREEDDYWVNRTFERFWVAVTEERFATFPNVAALLRYLKLCSHSVIVDDARTQRAAQVQPLNDQIIEIIAAPDTAQETVGNMSSTALWQAIEAEMHDETERLVAYLSFVQEMKPREISTAHPEFFADVHAVYRLKRNLLDRLQRSGAIQQFKPQ